MNNQYYTSSRPSQTLPATSLSLLPPATPDTSLGEYQFVGGFCSQHQVQPLSSGSVESASVGQPTHGRWQCMQLPPGNQAAALSERDLKRLKRKQANRDAARRSKIRRKHEAQELATRLEELKAENQHLEREVADMHSEVSELAEVNKICRQKLAGQGKDLGCHPQLETQFRPPENKPSTQVVPTSEGNVSIPEVLEFSREYGAQLGVPDTKAKCDDQSSGSLQSNWDERLSLQRETGNNGVDAEALLSLTCIDKKTGFVGRSKVSE